MIVAAAPEEQGNLGFSLHKIPDVGMLRGPYYSEKPFGWATKSEHGTFVAHWHAPILWEI
jgi:hypothetical protein